MKKLAARAYKVAFNAYEKGPAPELNEWLDQLPLDVIKMLDPNKLPEHLKAR